MNPKRMNICEARLFRVDIDTTFVLRSNSDVLSQPMTIRNNYTIDS